MSVTSVTRLLERIGAQGEGFVAYLGGLGYLTLDTAKHTGLGILFKPRIKADETFFQMVRLGVRAIPIIFLVQIFVGMILALQLAPVLADYGQLDKVATVVSIAVFRELGPLISAVVLTGFAGAAIAAELGTMVVGEEIAALTTSAVNPIRFLVVPRVIACILMTVALTVLADIVGAIGGGLVDRFILMRDSWEYYHTTIDSLQAKDFVTGLIKSGIFGFLIAMIACYEGLGVRGGAEGVGRATTQSVVLAIFLIIAADCAFTTVFYFFW